MPLKSLDNDEGWGTAPWGQASIPKTRPIPARVDVAVIGGGFTGLVAAAWLRHCARDKVVAVFERYRLGAGGSGRTGGMALPETANGDLPGLGNVLEGFKTTLDDLGVSCDSVWDGVYEIAHRPGGTNSVLQWQDSGPLRVTNEIPGGSIDPGRLLGGLAGAAENLGVLLFEHVAVTGVQFKNPIRLELSRGEVRADRVLFATNAYALELSELQRAAQPKLTLALATGPMKDADLEAVGLLPGKPFYTIDLPYLWGRIFQDNRVIFGSGLVHVKDWRELDALDVRSGEPAHLLASLESRVRRLHPALGGVEITHRWAGPILFPNDGCLFFHTHPLNANAVVLAGYTGQGVTLSVHLGRWAAEVLLDLKRMPAWNAKSG